MVFGGVNNERIQFNEETVWDGVPTDYNNPEALKALPEVRRLLFEGDNVKAKKLAGKKMMGTPHKVKSYQTLADVHLDFPRISPAKSAAGQSAQVPVRADDNDGLTQFVSLNCRGDRSRGFPVNDNAGSVILSHGMGVTRAENRDRGREKK